MCSCVLFFCRPRRRARSDMVPNKQHPTYNKKICLRHSKPVRTWFQTNNIRHDSQFQQNSIRDTKNICLRHWQNLWISLARTTTQTNQKLLFFDAMLFLTALSYCFSVALYVGLLRQQCQTNNIGHTQRICLRPWQDLRRLLSSPKQHLAYFGVSEATLFETGMRLRKSIKKTKQVLFLSCCETQKELFLNVTNHSF